MSSRYNLYNLEAPFRNYLLAGNLSSVTLSNYLSDFRHFAGWVALYADSHFKSLSEAHQGQELDLILNKKTLLEYRSYLMENKLPHKTVNRRLSTIRKLCSFCISQGWLTENAAKKVANITLTTDPLLDEFEHYLVQENKTEAEIEEIRKNTEELLVIN